MPRFPKLSQGVDYLAIPGPSVIPDVVLRAMHRPSPNIYAGELVTLTESLIPDLKSVARTAHQVAIYIGNGHAAWEAALANTISVGDQVLVPASGQFSRGWADMAQGLGADVLIQESGPCAPFDLDRVAQALTEDRDHRIKAVLGVHVDTATGVRNDLSGLRDVLDAQDHPALLMADCIASLGCDKFEMDGYGVDVMVAACQKGLMTPAGLGFVFFNERAAEVRAAQPRVSRYWDWQPRTTPDYFYEYFGGTAPTHHLFGLRAALDLIMEEGLEQVWHRHEILARAIWAACEAWGQDGPLSLNVAERGHRSHAVTPLRLDPPQATRLRNYTERNLGMTLGIGLGMAPPEDPAWHGYFRIGHMGHVNGHMIMGMLGGIETGLRALDIPHGRGALEAASIALAGKTG